MSMQSSAITLFLLTDDETVEADDLMVARHALAETAAARGT
jgi:hypothetical protein